MRARTVRTIISATVGLTLFAAGIVQHRAAAAWAAFEQRHVDLDAAAGTGPDLREAFWGETCDGAAAPHYDRAIAAVAALLADHAALVRTLPMQDDAEAAAASAELRARHRLVIDEVRLGAHCRDGRTLAPRPAATGTPVPALLAMRDIVNLAMLEVRALRAAGHGRAAVELTLDAATFAADHTQPDILIRTMIGTALAAIVAEGWPEPALATLDADSLALLAGGLARFDARLPDVLDFGPELRFSADALTGALYPRPTLQAWGYGFSTRWMLADGFLAYDRVVRACAGKTSWQARRVAFDAALAPLAATTNPITATIVPNLMAAEQNVRETKTLLRFLRIAVDLHRGLEAPALADPLGNGTLSVAAGVGGWLVRSEGMRAGRHLVREIVR